MDLPTSQLFHIPVDILDVAGPDAESYLQGQLSQNVERLEIGESAYSLLLAPQGFVESWFRIVRRETDRFWLVIDNGFGESAKARLERFKLRVDCVISQEPGVLSVVRWDGKTTPIDKEAVVGRYLDSHVELTATWLPGSGFDMVGPSNVEIEGLEVGDLEAYERLRITSVQPVMGHELTEKTIPAAAGVVDRSVDFTKGCYVGQELVARVDSRGNNTPTRLYQITFDDGSVAVDDTVYSSTGEAGTVTSSAEVDGGSIALAYLKRKADLTTVWVEAGEQRVAGTVSTD